MRVVATIFVTLAALLSPPISSRALAEDSPDTPEEQKTVHLVLYPAAEPKPALKYRLLPPLMERRPGNAAVWWNRIPAERNRFFDDLYANDGPWTRMEKWMDIPIGDPREKAYREKELAKDLWFIRPNQVYSDMKRAAQFESCNWEQPLHEGNVIAMLLPEIQQARSYGRLLSAKAHLEIAEGKYDDAVQTLQCGYAEGRDVAQSPTLVSGLVGLTIAGMMSHQVQQLIQQPDAPNLYWALSTLPRPVVPMWVGAEAESNMLYLQFPELHDLDKKKLSPEGWRDLLAKIVHDFHDLWVDFGYYPAKSRDLDQAKVVLATLEGYPAAKRYLIERGRAAAEVEAMPVARVVLLYTVHVYNELSDAQFKWFFLPSAELGEGFARADRQFNEALAASREIIPIARFFLPAVQAAKEAETRTEWNLAVLRIFEAMRLYAANHDGRWPERLSDVTEVPIPKNPYDGGPFIYDREGNKAVLTAEKGPRNWHRRYEITLMPKAK
jgi:hypothetical protein